MLNRELPCSEKIQHGSDTKHDTSRNGIPFQPKRDKGWSDQYDIWYEYRCEVKISVPAEDKFNFQAAVIPYNNRNKHHWSTIPRH